MISHIRLIIGLRFIFFKLLFLGIIIRIIFITFYGHSVNFYEIWNYSSKKVRKIKQNQNFRPLKKEEVLPLLERYYYYFNCWDEYEPIFKQNFNAELLLQEENYYAYFDDVDNGEYFTILILDVKANQLYKLSVW